MYAITEIAEIDIGVSSLAYSQSPGSCVSASAGKASSSVGVYFLLMLGGGGVCACGLPRCFSLNCIQLYKMMTERKG